MTQGRTAFGYVVPVFIGVIFLGAEVLSSLFREQEQAQILQVQVSEIDVIGDLVHELQRERGYSSGVLASGGQSLHADLLEQRGRTDASMTLLRQVWGVSGHSEEETEVLRNLLSIRTLRQITDDHAVSSQEIVSRYSGVVANLLAAGIVTPHTVNAQIRLNMLTSALQAVSLAKDAAGLQRATGASILADPASAEALHGRFLAFGAQEEAFLNLATIHLREIQDTIFRDAIGEPHAVAAQRDLILAQSRNVTGDFDLSPEVWFAMSTDWIDRLRGIERDLQSLINESAAVLQQETRSQLLVNGAAVTLALLLLTLQLLFPPAAPKPRDDRAWAEDLSTY